MMTSAHALARNHAAMMAAAYVCHGMAISPVALRWEQHDMCADGDQAGQTVDDENGQPVCPAVVDQDVREQAWLDPLCSMLITVNADGVASASLPSLCKNHPELVADLLRSATALASASNVLARNRFVDGGGVVPNVVHKVADASVYTGMTVAVDPMQELRHHMTQFFNTLVSAHRAAVQSEDTTGDKLVAACKKACAASISSLRLMPHVSSCRLHALPS